MDNEVIIQSGYPEHESKVWNSFDPNEIRALFHLLNGQPDSLIKVFPKDVQIGFNDLQLLYQNVEDKLGHYIVGANEFSIDIKFDNGKIKNFGSWLSFTNTNFDIPEAIENVIMKWDCLLKLPNYEIPQKHTLVVRMSSGLNAQQVFQLLLSGEIEDMDSVERNLAPVICKVDFVNHRLAEEITNIVEEWNKTLIASEQINNRLKFIRKHKGTIANAIRYITPIVYAGTILVWIMYYLSNTSIKVVSDITVNQLKSIICICFFGYITYNIVKRVAFILGKKVIESAMEYGDTFTFAITKGDSITQLNLARANNKYTVDMILSILVTILINIICGIIVNHLWQMICTIKL
ncbi:hypothetical protein [Cellulosilyticum sp. WCF-2]|uniref:hypothetical protein n=1 Tax=Cellulosilyticum sp. WCF-2 TaxID=2497860 RepID=UPI000F8D344E|nr:hypothetical protein [Cellulosilyticum sp. WCF-2]QEH68232.1 hypothetical protein EKH84_07445 [Cellulosilyticum sp. WCF-2]